MSFRRKTYPEIADNLLNRLLGGVSGEAHAFPPPGSGREPFAHPLEKGPADALTSVFGYLNGQSHGFAIGVDVELAGEGRQVVWKTGGARPDAGTVVEVNYLPKNREARANDLYVGSVSRTLLEAMALETAGLYAQMEVVYKSGFIDTAEGGALDHVVSLLGVNRVRAGRNLADVRFTRAGNLRGEITIPAGTRVLTADGSIEYETLDDAVLADGQQSVLVPARDLLETNDGIGPEQLQLLARPIAGIEGVSNPGGSSRLDRDESDAELRARAKSFLAASERGTKGAIEAAVARHNLRAEVSEGVGSISVVVHDYDSLSDEIKRRLEASIKAVKPAGVVLSISAGAAPRVVDIELQLSTAADLLESDLKRIQAEIAKRFEDYFTQLPIDSQGSATRLIGLAMGVAGVEDVRFTSVLADGSDALDKPERGQLQLSGRGTRLGALKMVDPSLATRLVATVRFPQDAPGIPDQATIRSALQDAVSYLNEINAAPMPADAKERARRSLGWGKLARLVPLPGHAALKLKDYDDAQGLPGAPSPATAAGLAPFKLEFAFVRPGGQGQLVTAAGGAGFELAAFERLALDNVAVNVAPKEAG